MTGLTGFAGSPANPRAVGPGATGSGRQIGNRGSLGILVIADSTQFSGVITEVADQPYVGTALTIQFASGFALATITIWLVPFIARSAGRQRVTKETSPVPWSPLPKLADR